MRIERNNYMRQGIYCHADTLVESQRSVIHVWMWRLEEDIIETLDRLEWMPRYSKETSQTSQRSEQDLPETIGGRWRKMGEKSLTALRMHPPQSPHISSKKPWNEMTSQQMHGDPKVSQCQSKHNKQSDDYSAIEMTIMTSSHTSIVHHCAW